MIRVGRRIGQHRWWIGMGVLDWLLYGWLYLVIYTVCWAFVRYLWVLYQIGRWTGLIIIAITMLAREKINERRRRI